MANETVVLNEKWGSICYPSDKVAAFSLLQDLTDDERKDLVNQFCGQCGSNKMTCHCGKKTNNPSPAHIEYFDPNELDR